jgi:hypothetical protein
MLAAVLGMHLDRRSPPRRTTQLSAVTIRHNVSTNTL